MISIALGMIGLLMISAYVLRVIHAIELSTTYIEAKGHLALLKPDAVQYYHTQPKKYFISEGDYNKVLPILQQTSDIEVFSKVILNQGFINSEHGNTAYMGIGVEKNYFQYIFNNSRVLASISDWINRSASFMPNVENRAHQVSVTSIMAKNLRTDLHSSVQLLSQTMDGSFSAVDADLTTQHSTGMELKEPFSLITTYELLSDLIQNSGASYVAIFLKDENRIAAVKKMLSQKIKDSNIPLIVTDRDDRKWNTYLAGTSDFLYFVGSFFSILVLTGCVLSIISFNFLNYQERKLEIGILRSMGYTTHLTKLYFLFESIFLSLFGIVVGVFCARLVTQVVNHAHIKFTAPGVYSRIDFILEFSWSAAWLLGLVCLFVCLSISWWQSTKLIHEEINNLLHNSGV